MTTISASRRAVIGALAISPLIAAPAIAAPAGDATILAAWDRRVNAYAAYLALPEERYGFENPEEDRLWSIIDEAEETIRSTFATTPRGVMIQLWCGMYHSITRNDQDVALTAGDFAALEGADAHLDWNARLMLAALRSLKAMEDRA